jgi:hypothetical protein
MNKENVDIEQLLQHTFQDKELEVPPIVWDKIEQEIYPKKKRRFPFWIWLCVIPILIVGIYFFKQSHQFASLPQVSPPQKSSTPSADISSKNVLPPTDKNQGEPNQTQIDKQSSPTNFFTAEHQSNETNLNGIVAENNNNSLANDKMPSSQKSIAFISENETSNTDLQKINHSKAKTINTLYKTATLFPLLPLSLNAYQSSAKYLGLTKKDSNTNKLAFNKKRNKISVNINAGTTYFDMALYKNYFATGALSNRNFTANGVDLQIGFYYPLSQKISLKTDISFNQKNAEFNYALRVSSTDFLNYNNNKTLIPIESLDENVCNKCAVINDAETKFSIQSSMLQTGIAYNFLSRKKFTLSLIPQIGLVTHSALKVKSNNVVAGIESTTENANAIITSCGTSFYYQISPTMQIGILPSYRLMVPLTTQSFNAKVVKEFVLPISACLHF